MMGTSVESGLSSTAYQPAPVAAGSAMPIASTRRNVREEADPGSWQPVSPDQHRPGSLSIVIPVMNEEGNLHELHRRLTTVLERISLPYQIIFVDDGSRDGTWPLIRSLCEADRHIIALRHRRNFGKAQALANGFAVAQGDVVITMDGDLQDDPDELPRFLAKLDEG